MSHAEKCPVCEGKGVTSYDNGVSILFDTCHGCHGKCWVEVQDSIVPYITPEATIYIPWQEPVPCTPWDYHILITIGGVDNYEEEFHYT